MKTKLKKGAIVHDLRTNGLYSCVADLGDSGICLEDLFGKPFIVSRDQIEPQRIYSLFTSDESEGVK